MAHNNESPIEKIKRESSALRGSLVESLQDELTGAIREHDQALIKFHGIYQQDDRDLRAERAEKKLERLYSFMIRLRLPAGILTAEQWVATHHIAGAHSTGVIKITSRQTVQLHGIIKSKLKPTIHAFNQAELDSIATCGDINRNVVCSAHPAQSPLHGEISAYASAISSLLLPTTRAYYEIWLDEEKIAERVEKEDELYKETYLPRKFKIAIAIPPNNDADVFTNDIGLIAIVENGQLQGFNIAVGGGLSTTHGNPATYARLGTVIGFVEGKERVLKAVYEILTIQRDYGNRSDRKQARLKYTVDKLGVDWFVQELEKRAGFALQEPRPYRFTERQDYFGWQRDHKGYWHYTVFTENGRVLDSDVVTLKEGLLEVARTGKVLFRFTCNQNVILSDIKEEDKPLIGDILRRHNIIALTEHASAIRRNAMACVALNTCPLALAEGQRYLPLLLLKIEPVLATYGLEGENIVIRMTGCPNGCSRPYVAEIGFVGTSYGHYNLYLGGDQEGTRLNTLYKEHLNEERILAELHTLLSQFSKERKTAERFGDFAHRIGWVGQ